MMGHEAMEAGAGELQSAHEAEGAAEVQETTMKKRKMVIIGADLCKCTRSQIGKAGCSVEKEEEITALPPYRPRLASAEPERVSLSDDETQVLKGAVNDIVHIAPSETYISPLMMRCSCKCGCGQAGTKLKTCRKCSKHVCYADCDMYQRCHWCVMYPEDIG